MTKGEMVDSIRKVNPNLSKKSVEEILGEVFSMVGKSIKVEKRFSYPGFGTFTVKNRKARVGRNPRTGEEIKIKASKTVSFKPAPTLKASL